MEKKKRHNAYYDILEYMSENKTRYDYILGICNAASKIDGLPCCYHYMDKHYPELWKFNDRQQNNTTWAWFDDEEVNIFLARQLILEFCIEMTR